MAVQTRFNGYTGIIQVTGKVGEVVGQKSVSGKLIIRKRATVVANPKTSKQASQRMKMLPAQRIASALKEIVDRGQQGVKYGALSRSAFMKRALKMVSGFPYMEKDDTKIIPGEYQLTKGTLPEVFCTCASNKLVSTLNIDSNLSADTIGEVSANLLAENSYLQAGDQITVVVFTNPSGTPIILSAYKSFILDADATEAADEVLNVGGNLLSMADDKFGVAGGDIVAGAVIISRANGADSFLRSNATLAVDKTNAVLAPYFNSNASARQSYQGNTTIASNDNWPVDADDEVNVNGSISGGSNGSISGGSSSNTPSAPATVAAPVISGDTPFADTSTVTITGPSGATIYYTTNGSAPTSASQEYSTALTLEATTTVKAIAVKSKTFTKSAGGNVDDDDESGDTN